MPGLQFLGFDAWPESSAKTQPPAPFYQFKERLAIYAVEVALSRSGSMIEREF